MDKINIAFIANIDYIKPFTVALTSLLENNLAHIGRVFLICDKRIKDDKNLRISLEFFKKKYHKEIEPIFIDSSFAIGLKITHHISIDVYSKLILDRILPDSLETVLYLDSDIVINEDISKIKEMSFGDDCYLFAADHKYTPEKLERFKKMGINLTKYFNAGIMLINLKLWREKNLSIKLLETARKYNEDILWLEQDVLNIVLKDKWQELDYKYNAFALETYGKEIRETPCIIHYTGSSKPWHFMNEHPYKSLYWKYLRKTPFKWYIPEDLTILNIIKKIIPKRIKSFFKKYLKNTGTENSELI